MKPWAALAGIFIWYIMSTSGYTAIGTLALALLVIYALLPEKKASKSKEKKADYEQLDPIIIESKRGAPYRIPEKMTLTYKEKSKIEKSWADNVVVGITSIFKSAVKMGKDLLE